jgi:hypothetical protein
MALRDTTLCLLLTKPSGHLAIWLSSASSVIARTAALYNPNPDQRLFRRDWPSAAVNCAMRMRTETKATDREKAFNAW